MISWIVFLRLTSGRSTKAHERIGTYTNKIAPLIHDRAQKLENLACPVRGISADERTHIGKLGTRARQAERASRPTIQSRQALPGYGPTTRFHLISKIAESHLCPRFRFRVSELDKTVNAQVGLSEFSEARLIMTIVNHHTQSAW